MIMTLAGHAQELTPIIDLSAAIGVHRAVNHHRIHASVMHEVILRM